LLERPARVAALTSAARTALRARQRQYQLRAQLEDLERARAELDAAARRKDEFIAMLGHELRNPLAPIRNAIEVLSRESHRPRDRTMLGMMRRQVDHMVRLVEDLVDVARLTRGTIELRLQPTSLPEVLHSAVALSRPLIDAGGHALDLDLPGGTADHDGRSDAARAGVQQPAQQRVEVFGPRPRDPVVAATRGRHGGGARGRPRHRHRTAHALAHLRSVHARARPCRRMRTAAWASASRSCAACCGCTTATSRCAATGVARDRNSSCACR
jgi:hypothetical protein